MLVTVAGWSLLFRSCKEEMELPEGFYQDLLVVNCILDPDSVPSVNVSKSLMPVGFVEFEYVNNAEIQMGLAGGKSDTSFLYKDLGWYFNNTLSIEAGQEYIIEVSSIPYPHIASSTVVPDKPVVTDVSLKGDTVSLSINDALREDNYYFVTLNGWKTIVNSILNDDGTYSYSVDTVFGPLTTISEEEYIEAFYSKRYGWVNSLTGITFDDEFWSMEPRFEAESYVFSDLLFDGNIIRFDIKVGQEYVVTPHESPALELCVHSIDNQYFRYLVSVARYLTTDETPFTERAKVYNNIDGGYGVFGSMNGIRTQIDISDFSHLDL